MVGDAASGGRVSAPRSTAEVKVRSDRALAVPLLRFLGASLADGPDGFWRIDLQRGPNSLNAVDAVHGGVIATVLDVAAYLAVLPQLTAAEEAVTIAFSASYLAAAGADEPLRATGGLIRRTRHLAFATAELRSEDRLLALATVTKAIRGST
jgi:uncharacterized protein (TIGR00369 family)